MGPSVRLDPRNNAVRRDVADIDLAESVFAPHYARATPCHCTAPTAMLRDAPQPDARAVSQLLLGEEFAVLDVAGGWAWGYSRHDRYVGYLPAEAIGPFAEPTHIVAAAGALVFAAPDIKSAVVARWPIGARFCATPEGNFLATTAGYVHARHARAIGIVETDPVAVAGRLLGMPYLWGGRGGDGIDCSGLVQLAYGLCGVALPRDSDQQRACGREVPAGDPLRRGDLVFLPGHVGMMTGADRLIHANAFWMAVTVEPLAEVVARLAGGGSDPVLARRRIG